MAAAAQQMHETNRRLRDFLELIPQQESGPLRIGPADLTSLLAELKNVERFRKNEINADARLDTELAEYRKNLEDLRGLLPSLQARYIAERARLEHDRSHLQAAAGWAQTQEILHRR